VKSYDKDLPADFFDPECMLLLSSLAAYIEDAHTILTAIFQVSLG